eukprot:13760574-Ditylum_brightwellii.AAC.1
MNDNLPQFKPPTPACLLKVFVDNFIAATNDTTTKNLHRLSCAVLHGIHCIFPPPNITGHCGANLVSESKLDKGG